jgi:Arc/MetJ-type ribon-helix-helix transcriptional regulator
MPDDLKAELDSVEVDIAVADGEAPSTSAVIRYLLRLGLEAHTVIDDAEFDLDRDQRARVVRQAMVDWRRREERRD